MSTYVLKYGDQKLARLCKDKIVATYFHPLAGWAEIAREAAFNAAVCTLVPSFDGQKAYATGEYTELMQSLLQQRGQQEVERTIKLVSPQTPWMPIVTAALTLSNYYLLPLFFDLLEPDQVFVLPFRTGANAEALRMQRLWKQLCVTNNKRVDLVLVEAKHIEAAKLRVEGVPAVEPTEAELQAELQQQADDIDALSEADAQLAHEQEDFEPNVGETDVVAELAEAASHPQELAEALHDIGEGK